MLRNFLLPIASLGCLAFAVWTVVQSSRPVVAAAPVAPPARSEFGTTIAGAGLVEASSENVEVGSLRSGVVRDMFVRMGDRVKKGDPLFVLDDTVARAALKMKEAGLAAARARLERLQLQPRAEDVPPAQARVQEAEATLEDARNLYDLAKSVSDERAISAEEVTRRRNAVAVAEARLAEARAQLALLQAGAWKPDLAVSQADVALAESDVAAAKAELEWHTVRSPIDGQVLKRNLLAGEFAQAGALSTPLLVLGAIDRLHVRVDIDENDAWRFRSDLSAVAHVRGNSSLQAPLRFEWVEPYVVPKRSLTGDSTERVDTRVMQVVYSFDPAALPVLVGQQVDVFVEAGALPAAASSRPNLR
ncbi:MAG TPA: HlyD family efflux transporter periplasmic adaptor subunit [Planctomycetota bacterium]|nr:HlyD family efflux transporter periplasmic adaptor subunit [Planctomycetota bacterium]